MVGASFVLAALQTFLGFQAQAYWISDHHTITQAAVNGLINCNLLPKNFDGTAFDQLDSGNRGEDTNLLRKWTRYSHYYNPYFPIDMHRQDSSASVIDAVTDVESRLRGHGKADWNQQEIYFYVGRVVHHLQDATVPSHVTPVDHWMRDGFEAYTTTGGFPIPSSADCQQMLARPSDMLDLLRATALGTYSHMEQPYHYKVGSSTFTKSWMASFWELGTRIPKKFYQYLETQVLFAFAPMSENQMVEFGSYGSIGNHFGDENFVDDKTTVQMDPIEYQDFKFKQMQLAVLATERAIVWFDQNF